MRLALSSFSIGALVALALPAQAETAMDMAQRLEACDVRPILSARFVDDGRLAVRCGRGGLFRRAAASRTPPPGDGVTNFVPLAGALGPILGGTAAIAAMAGGGSSTSATSGTN